MSDTTFGPVSSAPVHHGARRPALTRLRAGAGRGLKAAVQLREWANASNVIETTCLLAALVASSAIVMSALAGARF